MAQKIPVLAAPKSRKGQAKGLGRGVAWREVDLDKLKRNLGRVLDSLGTVLAEAKGPDGFPLKEISVGLEVSAEGDVGLVGTITVGVTAGLTLTFKKNS